MTGRVVLSAHFSRVIFSYYFITASKSGFEASPGVYSGRILPSVVVRLQIGGINGQFTALVGNGCGDFCSSRRAAGVGSRERQVHRYAFTLVEPISEVNCRCGGQWVRISDPACGRRGLAGSRRRHLQLVPLVYE